MGLIPANQIVRLACNDCLPRPDVAGASRRDVMNIDVPEKATLRHVDLYFSYHSLSIGHIRAVESVHNLLPSLGSTESEIFAWPPIRGITDFGMGVVGYQQIWIWLAMNVRGALLPLASMRTRKAIEGLVSLLMQSFSSLPEPSNRTSCVERRNG